jgi:hypothetical protein
MTPAKRETGSALLESRSHDWMQPMDGLASSPHCHSRHGAALHNSDGISGAQTNAG